MATYWGNGGVVRDREEDSSLKGNAAQGDAGEGARSNALRGKVVLRTKPWERVVSIVLSVLLVATMSDFSGIQGAFAAQGGASQPAPQASSAPEALTAPDGDAPQDSVASDEGDASGDGASVGDGSATGENAASDEGGASGEEAPSDDAAASDSDVAASEGSSASSEASDVGDVSGAAVSSDASDSEAVETSEQVEPAVEPAIEAPAGLVPASQVEPAATEGRDDIARVLDPRATVFGAPQTSEGRYQVNGTSVNVDATLGQLRSTVGAGYLGGASEGDRVTVTVDAPYLYLDESGSFARTLSPAEWMSHGGEERGMRAALVADGVPEGWSAWARWSEEDGYQRLDDEDMRAGASGHVVFRYEGIADTPSANGRLRADGELPSFEIHLAGDVPASEDVEVRVGYDVRSFTSEEGVTETGVASGDLTTVTVRNEQPSVKADLAAERLSAPAEGSQGGWLSYKLKLRVPSGYPAASGLSVAWADGYDRSGANASDVRPMLWDVTGLDDGAVAALDPADEEATLRAGAKPLAADCDGRFALKADVDSAESLPNAEREVVLLAAVPYSAQEHAMGGGMSFPMRLMCALP
ncbi:hypothetical protein B5F40_03870 [Gordonibacter sp. An230]|uniref:hypothetical protein n=1 Tax=Gordonibacter sp. An230 TaxID=1965592 RepID=UPI000B382444|nr:hypothetical protein [Gordonibacter sp. An230]OUO91255.1 hypothetical protein B5F40_03870 [Gordonibacter sp. An230]